MTCCTINVKIAISIIGISAGIMAGLCFAVEYHNWSTTIMALTSSFFAGIATWMHLAYKKNWMLEWPTARFKTIFYSTAFLFVFSAAGMVGCLIAAGINHQTLTHEGLQGENLWMTAVWCFMTAKWTGQCAWFSRAYSSEMMRPLAHTPPIH